MRLVDGDELLTAFPVDDEPMLTKSCVRMTIRQMPTVDAIRVRHGHWIYHPDWQADGECGYECSACGMGSDVDYQFCMRCGAKMNKEDNEQKKQF